MARSVSNVGGIVHSGLIHEDFGGSGSGGGGDNDDDEDDDFLVRHNFLTK
jgi:hypothetical protein